LKIEWMLIAEGLGADSKNALTVIGVNQNIFSPPSLPAMTKRAILARVLDDEDTLKAGSSLQVAFSVIGPAGDVVAAQSSTVSVAGRLWKDLPGNLDIPAELGLSVNDYGEYVMRLDIRTPAGERQRAEVRLHVVPPPSRVDAS